MATETATNRADFLKRLFAVVVSVGAANQLFQINWSQRNAGLHAWLLFVGVVLVIQSWEGYFATHSNRPLENAGRFYLDVTIVFTYLALLSFSNKGSGCSF